MSAETAALARQLVQADQHIKEAVLRAAWIEAQTWQDTRDRLQEQRSTLLRTQWEEDREQQRSLPGPMHRKAPAA